ncbi:hypothetical protein HGM15179_010247 [Zosterops borbonicus]|uniref:Uncharacterized protein n=1 Tax=Zosterops borbonicus TaxID=364589 RepID=A0A8K1LK24_9PASS|nr:hypothetical protein HGM15179_010247 [Zosterops borbonicus]
MSPQSHMAGARLSAVVHPDTKFPDKTVLRYATKKLGYHNVHVLINMTRWSFSLLGTDAPVLEKKGPSQCLASSSVKRGFVEQGRVGEHSMWALSHVVQCADAFFCLPLHKASQKIFSFESFEVVLAQENLKLDGRYLGSSLQTVAPVCRRPPNSYPDPGNMNGPDASFLSESIGEPVIHDRLETIETTYSSHLDLKDTPIENAETWFTDRSSYVVSGKRHAGYAVTISREDGQKPCLLERLKPEK